MKLQNQKGGDASTNYLAEKIEIRNEISYRDVKDIALDVFNLNFIRLKEEAFSIISSRAEEFIDNLLRQIIEKDASILKRFLDPALQMAIYNSQKEFAKNGDIFLGEVLITLLIERANTFKRNLHQIQLEESLSIVPKLTFQQLDILTLNFVITSKTFLNQIQNLEDLKEYFNKKVVLFSDGFTLSSGADFLHLRSLGCIQKYQGHSIQETFVKKINYLFSEGFSLEEFINECGSENVNFIISHNRNKEKYQFIELPFNALNKLSKSKKEKILNFRRMKTLNVKEINEIISNINPKIISIIKYWNEGAMRSTVLTRLGVIIGHANYCMRTNDKIKLPDGSNDVYI